MLRPARQGPSALAQLKTLQARYLLVPLCPQLLSSCTSLLGAFALPTAFPHSRRCPHLACVTWPCSPSEQSPTNIQVLPQDSDPTLAGHAFIHGLRRSFHAAKAGRLLVDTDPACTELPTGGEHRLRPPGDPAISGNPLPGAGSCPSAERGKGRELVGCREVGGPDVVYRA